MTKLSSWNVVVLLGLCSLVATDLSNCGQKHFAILPVDGGRSGGNECFEQPVSAVGSCVADVVLLHCIVCKFAKNFLVVLLVQVTVGAGCQCNEDGIVAAGVLVVVILRLGRVMVGLMRVRQVERVASLVFYCKNLI